LSKYLPKFGEIWLDFDRISSFNVVFLLVFLLFLQFKKKVAINAKFFGDDHCLCHITKFEKKTFEFVTRKLQILSTSIEHGFCFKTP